MQHTDVINEGRLLCSQTTASSYQATQNLAAKSVYGSSHFLLWKASVYSEAVQVRKGLELWNVGTLPVFE